MIAHIPIKCPYCKKNHNISEEQAGDLLSHMKMNKVLHVAQQMHDKSGPFYDRWVKAMEAKGPQMRCKWCVWFHDAYLNPRFEGISCYGTGRRGGHFACKFYLQRSGD